MSLSHNFQLLFRSSSAFNSHPEQSASANFSVAWHWTQRALASATRSHPLFLFFFSFVIDGCAGIRVLLTAASPSALHSVHCLTFHNLSSEVNVIFFLFLFINLLFLLLLFLHSLHYLPFLPFINLFTKSLIHYPVYSLTAHVTYSLILFTIHQFHLSKDIFFLSFFPNSSNLSFIFHPRPKSHSLLPVSISSFEFQFNFPSRGFSIYSSFFLVRHIRFLWRFVILSFFFSSHPRLCDSDLVCLSDYTYIFWMRLCIYVVICMDACGVYR